MNLRAIILFVLVGLSVAAGAAKVLQMPQETEFFGQAGFGMVQLVLLGLAQIAGGILALIKKTRTYGLLLLAFGFLVSAIVIFSTGNAGFAVFSILPVVLAIWLLVRRQMAA